MNRHIQDIVSVGYINTVAAAISMSDIETSLRICSLILACTFTAVKLWQAIKKHE